MGKSIENKQATYFDEEIDYCLDAASDGLLNSWEEDFISDMDVKRNTNEFLTAKQSEKIIQIYTRLIEDGSADE